MWKGGEKLAIKRKNHKRRQMGFNPLNYPFDGSVAHHINKNDVIFIPYSLHISGHNHKKPKTMEMVNGIAFFYLKYTS